MKEYVGNMKEYVKNMKKYERNMKEYVKNIKKDVGNMKEYVKNLKKYGENMKESLPSYMVSGTSPPCKPTAVALGGTSVWGGSWRAVTLGGGGERQT